MGGPEMAPHPPNARRASAEPWRSSVHARELTWEAPKWPPTPPTLVAPRRSRGAPRFTRVSLHGRPRNGPPPPQPSSRLGGAVAPLGPRAGAYNTSPQMAYHPPNARRASAEPWRSSVHARELTWEAPKWPPTPPTLVAPRRSRGAPRFTR